MSDKQADNYGNTYEELNRVLDKCKLNRAERMGVLYLVLADEVRGAQNEMYGDGVTHVSGVVSILDIGKNT